MKSDFIVAITQLSAEKNLPKEVVLHAVEAALVSAYKKDQSRSEQDIHVKINPVNGEVKVYARKLVVEELHDPHNQIELSDALKMRKEVQVDDVIDIEITPANAGRIAAQTAKQVVLQRLREAERDIAYEEYIDKEGHIIMGIIQRMEPKQIIVDLGKSEAVLPTSEQVRTERYRIGQRLKLFVLEVRRATKGPQIMVSRSHSDLLRRLFELEVPEIQSGTVELKAVAREAGHRSKVAVEAHQEGLDPVGSCVGLRGIRIQNVSNELNGERIDIIQWHADLQVYIANALSPAQVHSVKINREKMSATVVVPDNQLSLAIGKEGQNVRLAAKLVGWKIDIKSVSAFEEEVGAEEPVVEEPVVEQPAVPVDSGVVTVSTAGSKAEPVVPSQIVEELPLPEIEEEEIAEPEEIVEAVPFESEVEPETPLVKVKIRFAEDILLPLVDKPDTSAKAKKGKKKKSYQSEDKDKSVGIVKRKGRRSHFTDYDDLDEDDF